MKRLMALVLVALIAIGLTACGGGNAATNATTTTETTKADMTTAQTQAESSMADAVTAASVTDDVNALVAALKADGTWIAAALNDMTYDDEIVVEGAFNNDGVVDRKLALYTSDENFKVVDQFTLTAPKLIVKSPHFRINGGTLAGDVYVEADQFMLQKQAKIDGNLTFKTKANLDSFVIDDTSVVTGTVSCEEVDVVTTPSLVTDAKALIKGLSADGTWIVAAYNNMVLSEDLIVEGEFTHRDAIARKLGLYSQDDNRNTTATFSLTVPNIIVRSENFTIKGGPIVGNILVEANGFKLDKDTTVKGNIVFATEEYKNSFVMDDMATIEGEISVK